MKLLEAESFLIKCLECRLIGPPPRFNLTQPPSLPAELINSDLFASLLNDNGNKQQLLRQLKNIKLKRCLGRGLDLNPLGSVNYSSSLQQQQPGVDVMSRMLDLTPAESLLVFLISFTLFVIVLLIALIFVIKLFRIRKQLRKCKLTSSGSCKTIDDKSHNMHLSSSLSSGSSNMSKTNTITSHLILTPSSSILLDQHFKQIKQSGIEPTSSSCAFYNQLFENSRPHSASSSESYLTTGRGTNVCEYDEINSQLYNICYPEGSNQHPFIIQPLMPIKQSPFNMINSSSFTYLHPQPVSTLHSKYYQVKPTSEHVLC